MTLRTTQTPLRTWYKRRCFFLGGVNLLHRVYGLWLEWCSERLGSVAHEHLVVSSHYVVVTASVATVIAEVVHHLHVAVVVVSLPLVASVHAIVRLQGGLDVGVVGRQCASDGRQARQSFAEQLGIVGLCEQELPVKPELDDAVCWSSLTRLARASNMRVNKVMVKRFSSSLAC